MTKNYENYSLENFITDEDFIDWINNPKSNTAEFWENFQKQFPEKISLINQARLGVENLAIASKMPVAETDAPQVWEPIEVALKAKNSIFFKRNYWAAAASIVFLFGCFFWLFNRNNNSQKITYLASEESIKSFIEKKNTSTTKKSITLQDNSIVVLEPNATLLYPKKFAENVRQVILKGEAFFTVQRNAKKPFIVLANNVITKVLGTSFVIKADKKDSPVIVSVKTGKVSVFLNQALKNQDPEEKGIVLLPNQKVIVESEKEQFKKSLVDEPMPITSAIVSQKFTFKNELVSKVFTALQDSYGIEIVYDNEILAHCNITTSLGNEPLFQKLDIICEAIGANYKIVDAKIIISSKGCN